MGHGLSWFSFFPGYKYLGDLLNDNFIHTVIIGNAEKMAAHHIYAALLVFIIIAIMAIRV